MLKTQTGAFTHDVLGRYLCNTFEEAMASTDASTRPDARPFDVIVLGGGSFGPVLAAHLFGIDSARRHRILVLDGGRMVLPEHIQNLPPMLGGLGTPGASSIHDLRQQGLDRDPRNEVWGLAWHANHRFPGLAYCLGGRSIFFGGWSPEPIDSELTEWPGDLVVDLKSRHYPAAKTQLGTDVSNDFIFGPLHEALRQRLITAIRKDRVAHALPVKDASEVEAPLAVVSASTRPGYFPPNKFSAVPPLFRAARLAQSETGGDDVKKRLMVVPGCHVTRLVVDEGRVTAVKTNLGDVPVSPNAAVVIALGTIESTRLALLSFPNGSGLIGRNLMAHLRSNLTIRVPRESFEGLPPEVSSSAMFVKGKAGRGHFHIQVTASGVAGSHPDSEAELWKKIPDIDWMPAHRMADDRWVVITLRGIGEMFGDKTSERPVSRVELDPEPDEFGERRAIVHLSTTEAEEDLWRAMDETALDVGKALAGGAPIEYLHPKTHAWQPDPPLPFGETGVHDGLGTTHHEAGTLWMGEDSATSVTDPMGRFHEVRNAYVAGPALFPTCGSPNPMLSGVALARRTAEAIVADASPVVEPGFTSLFDGRSLEGWRMAGPGRFVVAGGSLETEGGMGLLWHAGRTYSDFVLRLDWMTRRPEDNSGVFIRFPDPGGDPWVAVHQGYEVQIDDLADPVHRTGAIYGFAAPSEACSRGPGQWNAFEIEAKGQRYRVKVNGREVTTFEGDRGIEGHIGLQNHDAASLVSFRNVRIKPL